MNYNDLGNKSIVPTKWVFILTALVFTTILGGLFLATPVKAQTKVKADVNGNYIAVSDSVKTVAKSTGKTFKDSKGIGYPVFVSAKGKLFYTKIAKTSGKKYNVYITTN